MSRLDGPATSPRAATPSLQRVLCRAARRRDLEIDPMMTSSHNLHRGAARLRPSSPRVVGADARTRHDVLAHRLSGSRNRHWDAKARTLLFRCARTSGCPLGQWEWPRSEPNMRGARARCSQHARPASRVNALAVSLRCSIAFPCSTKPCSRSRTQRCFPPRRARASSSTTSPMSTSSRSGEAAHRIRICCRSPSCSRASW